MREYYVQRIQPIDDRTNHIILGRRSTVRFTAVVVRLRWWDRMAGRTLLDKTIIVYARAERACDKANQEGKYYG